jgi:hypothetical protein
MLMAMIDETVGIEVMVIKNRTRLMVIGAVVPSDGSGSDCSERIWFPIEWNAFCNTDIRMLSEENT